MPHYPPPAQEPKQIIDEDLPHPDFMIQDMYARAEETRNRLEKILPDIANKFPCAKAIIPSLKDITRAEQKVQTDYKNDWRLLKDIVRATLAFESFDNLEDGIKLFSQEKSFEIIHILDRFEHPTSSGYRDVRILFRDKSNHMIGEIQFHLCSIANAKKKEHKIYQKIRNIKAEIETLKRPLNDEERQIISSLERTSSFHYTRAFFEGLGGKGCDCSKDDDQK